MSYQNAIDILPVEIIEEIQKYMDGGTIYIPKKTSEKLPWGTKTETKQKLSLRNLMIYHEFIVGITCQELSQKYFLDIKSIQRIIRQIKRENELD